MRALVFLVVSGAAHYVAARWILAVSPGARRRRRLVWTVACALSLVLAAMRVLGWVLRSTLTHALMTAALVELAVLVIALVPIAIVTASARAASRVVDRVRPPASEEERATRITRREALERGAGLSLVGATGVTLGWGIVRGRHAFEVEEVVIPVAGWPRALDGYTIAQVSDIHVGPFVGDR